MVEYVLRALHKKGNSTKHETFIGYRSLKAARRYAYKLMKSGVFSYVMIGTSHPEYAKQDSLWTRSGKREDLWENLGMVTYHGTTMTYQPYNKVHDTIRVLKADGSLGIVYYRYGSKKNGGYNIRTQRKQKKLMKAGRR